MAIEFPCPTCRQLVRTPDAAAGKKGKCPECGTVVIIPSPVTVVRPSQPPASAPAPKPSPSPGSQQLLVPTAATAGGIEFPCPLCRQTVRTPASAAGKKGKCPHCQSVVQIPATARAAPQPAGLAALPPAPASPYGGLVRLPAGPAQARPPRDPLPTLTPVATAAPLPTLTPLPALKPLPTLQPIPADPLAGLPVASVVPARPLTHGAPLNPYSAPSGYPQPAYQPRHFYDGDRKGLPWENEPSMDSFGDTMSVVLGQPQEAFQSMRRRGGMGNAMGFFIIGGIIGQVANAVYATIVRGIIAANLGEGPFPLEAILTFGALEVFGGIAGVFIAGLVGTFVSAAIWHLALMMVGGANAGYEATYRAICFALGSIAVLNAIPIVGPFIGLFYVFIVLIHAFTHTHEIDGGKAALAVFLPLVLFLCFCCVPAGFLSLGGLLSWWTIPA